MTCGCGAPSPCSEHETTDAMRYARAALMALDDVQRGRVLCWFCGVCSRYVGPGDSCRHDEEEAKGDG